MTMLSEHFSYDELTTTSTGLPNCPGQKELGRLIELCQNLLEPIRTTWGAVRIHSGFRSPEVNTAVHGVPTSQHVLGEAADITPVIYGISTFDEDIDEVFRWIVKDSGLSYGQCINEHRVSPHGLVSSHWIHISLPNERHKQEALIYDGAVYKVYKR